MELDDQEMMFLGKKEDAAYDLSSQELVKSSDAVAVLSVSHSSLLFDAYDDEEDDEFVPGSLSWKHKRDRTRKMTFSKKNQTSKKSSNWYMRHDFMHGKHGFGLKHGRYGQVAVLSVSDPSRQRSLIPDLNQENQECEYDEQVFFDEYDLVDELVSHSFTGKLKMDRRRKVWKRAFSKVHCT